jgi:outer membrane lipoprotein-sorting protein
MRRKNKYRVGLAIGAIALLVLFLPKSSFDRTAPNTAIRTEAENETRRENGPVTSITHKSTEAEGVARPFRPSGDSTAPQPSANPTAAGHSTNLAAAPAANPDVDSKIPDSSLTADEILQAMREKYAKLSSYCDEGRMTRTRNNLHLTYQDVPFRTFFKRPRLYRFEWLGEHGLNRESYWSNSDGVFDRQENGSLRRFETLQAIFKAAMVESSYDVLQFLLPDSVPIYRNFFSEAIRLPDDTADGVPCFHLSGITPANGNLRELWIGIDDKLLRKVLTVSSTAYALAKNSEYKTGTETVITTYLNVEADIDLPAELFSPTALKN